MLMNIPHSFRELNQFLSIVSAFLFSHIIAILTPTISQITNTLGAVQILAG